MTLMTMQRVIQVATGDSCEKVFEYKEQEGGWQLLLCDTTKNSYRLNESLTPEVLIKLNGSTGDESKYLFINNRWQLQ